VRCDDVTRELYNALLEQRRDAYRRRAIVITPIQQYHEITAMRRGSDYFARNAGNATLKTDKRKDFDAWRVATSTTQT
jgi:hypothetical protein